MNSEATWWKGGLSQKCPLRFPQATMCLWDSIKDSTMEHRSETEVDGALGGQYIHPKAKEDKEGLKKMIDSHRDSTSPQGAPQDNGWSAT